MRVLGLTALLALSLPPPASAADGWRLSAPEAQNRATEGALTIIDIRRPQEWRETGLPEGAERATIRFGRGDAAFLSRIRALTGGDRDKPIALICAAGVRSGYAAKLLRRHGYNQVFDVAEGMLGTAGGPGWLRRGLPVEACDSC